MPFREYAANETSALIARLLAGHADLSVQRLRTFREAIEAASHAVESALATPAPADSDIQALVERLAEASHADADAAERRVAEHARKELDALRDELKTKGEEIQKHLDELETRRQEHDAMAVSMREQRAEIEALNNELEKQKEEFEGAATRDALARVAAEEELAEVRGLLDATLAEQARLTKLLETATAEKGKAVSDATAVQAELRNAQGQLQTAQAQAQAAQAQAQSAQTQAQAAQTQRDSLTAMLKAATTRVQALEKTHGEYERALKSLQAKVDEAAESESSAKHLATDAERDLERAHAAVDALNEEVLQFGSRLDETLEGFKRLAAAATIADVMTTFVKQLATNFSRVALFRVKGNRLEGEHHIGFDFQKDITNVVIPLGMDSLLARAVSSGTIEALAGADLADTKGMPFGGQPSGAVALPVVVGGETLALVYADDSGQQPHEQAAFDWRIRFAELLRQHAIALVMRLTNELKALAELREYAATLLNEAEHMYASDVSAGKKEADLRARLKDNVECARRIYAQRIATESPAAAPLLEEHLASVIEANNGTPFGRDLAAVAGRSEKAERGRRKAEAS